MVITLWLPLKEHNGFGSLAAERARTSCVLRSGSGLQPQVDMHTFITLYCHYTYTQSNMERAACESYSFLITICKPTCTVNKERLSTEAGIVLLHRTKGAFILQDPNRPTYTLSFKFD